MLYVIIVCKFAFSVEFIQQAIEGIGEFLKFHETRHYDRT